MAIKCPTEIKVSKGDTYYRSYTAKRVTDATANPETTEAFDLTSATIKFTAKRNRSDADADAVFQKATGDGITIDDAANGQFTVKVASSDTSSLDIRGEEFRDLFFDVEITLGAATGGYGSGDKITVDSGTLQVFDTFSCPSTLRGTKSNTIIKEYTVLRVTDDSTNPPTTTAMDLTGATITFTARRDRLDADSEAVFQKTTGDGITITDAAAGEFRVKVAESDTSGLDLGDDDELTLYYKVVVTFGATNGSYVSGDLLAVDGGLLLISSEITI